MAAIVNVCVDPRLNHEVVRLQVQSRLERLGLATSRVVITSDVGGNIGSAFSGTVDLLRADGEQVVFAVVLHHDDCVASRHNKRLPLATSLEAAQKALDSAGMHGSVLGGVLSTKDSTLTWSDQPARVHEVLNFRMPRL
jgi:hypothetical protein